MDGSFFAIGTILHRVPRDTGGSNGKRRPGSPKQGDRDPAMRDMPDGWIRVAL